MKIAHAANTKLGCVIGNLQPHAWTAVLRAKDPAVREKIAQYGEEAARYNVPYSQNKRNTGWRNYKSTGKFNGGYFDCSSLASAAAQRAGVDLGLDSGRNAPTTRTMVKEFGSTGKFDVLTSIVGNTANWMRGDIPVAAGDHTVIILEDGANIRPEPAKYIVGVVYELRANIRVRKSPELGGNQKLYAELTADGKKNALKQRMAVFKAGTRVTCKQTVREGERIWMRVPSGWLCAAEGSRVYIK